MAVVSGQGWPWSAGQGASLPPPNVIGSGILYPITATPMDNEDLVPLLPEPPRLPIEAVRVRYPGLEPCCVAWALSNAPFVGLKAGEANFLTCGVGINGPAPTCRTVMTWRDGAWEKASPEFQGW